MPSNIEASATIITIAMTAAGTGETTATGATTTAVIMAGATAGDTVVAGLNTGTTTKSAFAGKLNNQGLRRLRRGPWLNQMAAALIAA